MPTPVVITVYRTCHFEDNIRGGDEEEGALKPAHLGPRVACTQETRTLDTAVLYVPSDLLNQHS